MQNKIILTIYQSAHITYFISDEDEAFDFHAVGRDQDGDHVRRDSETFAARGQRSRRISH